MNWKYKRIAHLAAQKQIQTNFEIHGQVPTQYEKLNIRNQVKKTLVENNFNNYLLDDDHELPLSVACGKEIYEKGESWCWWALFNKEELVSFLKDKYPSDDIDDNFIKHHVNDSFGGASGGSWFIYRDEPWTKIVRNHVLVRQRCGFDV